MGAVYPATCGICGRPLADEESTRVHMGACYMTHKPTEP